VFKIKVINMTTNKKQSDKIKVRGREIKLNKTDKTTHKKIVPDTSVIINGILSDLINHKEIGKVEIIIPKFVLEELQAQASRGREIGFRGLEEIKRLNELDKIKKIKILSTGRRQTYEEIQLAKYGRVDSLIIEVAKKEKAVLYTSDRVQALAAEAEGVVVQYYEPYEKKDLTELSKLLTDDTMSLHLKEGALPLAKRGKPGAFKLVKIGKTPLTRNYLEKIISEITDAAKYEENSFIEMGSYEASVIQLRNMRISIARPPFSEALEITVVRPIVKATLDDYILSEKLKERLAERADGILIAGPPGSGKSTFAAALAEFYEKRGSIVKTMEMPRDLQVKKEITQYTALKGSFAKTADILLLVRPDYTVFDEIRKTGDFHIFSDLRLSGIGMIGVVHATKPIDAIQRFMGRIELGMIPHVIDTIIFIKDGRVERVYSVAMTVRSPTGMTNEDLARPLVEVRDFADSQLVYEIYTYGEENVVVKIKEEKTNSSIKNLAKKQIMHEIKKYDKHADVEFLSDNKISIKVDNKQIPRVIGKNGANIRALEKKLGLSIDISPKVTTLNKEVNYDTKETGAFIVFSFDKELIGKQVSFYSEKTYLFSALVGRKKQVKISKKSEIGRNILSALLSKKLRIFA